jgi:uncharacterized protein YcaQ
MRVLYTLTPGLARRLAVTRQRLSGPAPVPGSRGLLDLVRDLGCLQLDPIAVVARSHQLVLFSRAGPYNLAALERLLWKDRALFEYWAHCASIVLTEDYPLFNTLMMARHKWTRAAQSWAKQNEALRRHVLAQLRRRGPLLSRDLQADGLQLDSRAASGWNAGRDVNRMLDYLWISGQLMVTGRDGIQKRWDFSKHCLPDWAPRERLAPHEAERRAILKSLRALGVGTARDIGNHFMRGYYPNLRRILAGLEADGMVQRVAIKDRGETWPGTWYILADLVPALERLKAGGWSPRTVLLSPFDNLICDRSRTETLFDFSYRIEIYVPAALRKWGYYVLPLLHGDRLIGRMDSAMDRGGRQLAVHGLYAEPGAPKNAGAEVRRAIESLATFLGATKINYNKRRLPAAWKRALGF